MFTLFLIIFLSTIFLCLCTYAFYPLVIWLLDNLFPFKVQKADITPTVSVIIPAHNEQGAIEKKIQNTLALNYPEDRMEILVGSDGSTDQTAQIVRRYSDQRVRFFDYNENRGKTAVQNDLVKSSTGEIIVFTDAASFINPNTLKAAVRNFADNRTGCVAGLMRFTANADNLTTQSQGLYWRYERNLRELESRLGRLIGVDGPLYAIRRNFYVPLAPNLISDLMSPLLVLEMGKKVVLEPEAVVEEEAKNKPGEEFKTRRRITARGLVGLSRYGRMLNPFRYPGLASQIFFHKVLRWFVGPLVAVNLLVCLALSHHWFFQVVLVSYAAFFVASGLGWILDRLGLKVKLLIAPYYFTLVNLAATLGIIDFLRQKQAVTWQPVRD